MWNVNSLRPTLRTLHNVLMLGIIYMVVVQAYLYILISFLVYLDFIHCYDTYLHFVALFQTFVELTEQGVKTIKVRKLGKFQPVNYEFAVGCISFRLHQTHLYIYLYMYPIYSFSSWHTLYLLNNVVIL